MRTARFLSVYSLVTTALAAPATPWRLTSGEARVHVLELYTSEGCSSCPRADAYLRSLRHRAGLWTKFIPVAYHVDYWNGLGWRDRFSRPEFSARQRAQASRWGKGGVYTPGFVVDGSEVGPDGSETEAKMVRQERVGRLEVIREVDKLRVRFPVEGRWKASVAVLGNGMTTAVAAGENARSFLHHDFVVLGVESALLSAAEVLIAPPDPALALGGTRSLVVWVEREGDPRPVQAVGADVPSDFFNAFPKKELR